MVKKSCRLKKNQKKHRAFWLTIAALAVVIFVLNVLAWCIDGFSDWYVDHITMLWVGSYGRLMNLASFSVGEIMLAAACVLLILFVLFALILIFFRRRNGYRRFFGGYLRALLAIFTAVCLIMTLNCTILYHTAALDPNPEEEPRIYTTEELMALYSFIVDRCNYYAGIMERDTFGELIYASEATEVSAKSDSAESFSATDSSKSDDTSEDEIFAEAGSVEDYSAVDGYENDDTSEDEIFAEAGSVENYSVVDGSENGDTSIRANTDDNFEKMQETAKDALRNIASVYPRLAGYYPDVKNMKYSTLMCQMNMRGYYFPFSLEANVNAYMYIIQYPSTYCHELAHLHGYIYEDEANFLAFAACVCSSDDFFRYSGYLSVYTYVYNACMAYVTDAAERAALPVVSDQVKADNIFLTETVRAEVEERAVLDSETVDEVSDTLSDTSMKLNGVSDGIASYSRVVNLLLEYYDGTLY